MYKILTKKLLPDNDYQNIFEFRASHPELARKLGETLRAARLACREVGPEIRALLETRDLHTKRDVWLDKKGKIEGNLALSADVS
jgi:hypothetical protein